MSQESTSTAVSTAAQHHIVPLRVYLVIFGLLLLGTGTTVGAAYLDLGPLNAVVALTIAVAKAVLVVLYFMHIRYSTGLTRLVVAAGFFWLLILLALLFSDYWTRGWMDVPRGWF